jgi:hypothetical protein
MRIEDEVLVGAEHPVVLSASAPKEVRFAHGGAFLSSGPLTLYFRLWLTASTDRGCRGRVPGGIGIRTILKSHFVGTTLIVLDIRQT